MKFKFGAEGKSRPPKAYLVGNFRDRREIVDYNQIYDILNDVLKEIKRLRGDL